MPPPLLLGVLLALQGLRCRQGWSQVRPGERMPPPQWLPLLQLQRQTGGRVRHPPPWVLQRQLLLILLLCPLWQEQ